MVIFDRKKDFISIIAPSSGCDLSMDKLKEAKNLLNSRGFEISHSQDLLAGDSLPFFAAAKATRLTDLKDTILNDARIIWAFRGGYGCSEIAFDCLDISPTIPKILIGYSDITVLHLLFNQHYKMPTIHASVLTSLLGHQSENLDLIIQVLTGRQITINLEPINNIPNEILTGEVTGGNLTMFCNMIGTKLHPDSKGKILILEDVNENSYRVHRHLIHLKNSGIFDEVLAVIFADFTSSDRYIDQTIKYFCYETIRNIPAYRTAGIGHDVQNYPVIFGSIARIELQQLIINNQFGLI